jgi:hypothetical protein
MRKLLVLGICLLSTSSFAAVEIEAKANAARCMKNQWCELTSYHHALILNPSDENRSYHYRFSICSDTGMCVKNEKDFTVMAHTNHEYKWDGHASAQFQSMTQHFNYAQTEISGYEGKFVDHKNWVSMIDS